MTTLEEAVKKLQESQGDLDTLELHILLYQQNIISHKRRAISLRRHIFELKKGIEAFKRRVQ